MSFNTLDLVILKNIISNKKSALDFVADHDAKLFSPEVWNFANYTINYIKNYRELPTLRVVSEKLLKAGSDKLVENIKIIWEELDKIVVNENEFKHELEKIKQRYSEKQIMAAKDALVKLEPGSIDISKAITEMQKTIQSVKAVNRNSIFESKDIKDYLPSFVEKFNAKRNDPNLDRGILTKYSFLDIATNGLKPADFLVVAGETGFGKSLLLNNIAIQVWMQDNKIPFDGKYNEFTEGKNIIYFSLEMPYEDCFNRLISRLSGVQSRKIENANLTKEEFAKIKSCLDFINKYPYKFKIVDIADACANDLETILIETGEKYDAIFVDYLGIMRPNEKSEQQDWLTQGTISKELRSICRKYKNVMFSAVQLNRKASSKASKEPEDDVGLHRLARSATIATHTTHILQIETRNSEEKHNDLSLRLIKSRKGPKAKGTLIKDLACATLLDKNNDEDSSSDGYASDHQTDFFKDIDDISREIELLEL